MVIEFWDSERPILLPVVCPNKECKLEYLCGVEVVEGQLQAEACPTCGAEIKLFLSSSDDAEEQLEPEPPPRAHAEITWYFDGAQASRNTVEYAERHDVIDLIFHVAASGCFYYVTDQWSPRDRLIGVIRRLVELVPPSLRKHIVAGMSEKRSQPVTGGNGGDKADMDEFLSSLVRDWEEKHPK